MIAFVLAALLAQEPAATPTTTPSDTEATAPAAPAPVTPTPTTPPGGNRVMGVLPNYRTADASQEGTVLPTKQKFVIASKDSFDYPLVMLSAFYAGLGQLSNQAPSFGQGMKGYGHRLATNYADQAMGNLFTEGFYPALLHQDPRYFRRGTGSIRSRVTYAVTRVILTHNDSGRIGFNYSEWLGNMSSVALSNTYYPDGRTWGANTSKLMFQVGTDAASQVLKEFWPDIRRKLHRGN